MKVILTGAGGFIGSCYLWQLNSMGIHDVLIVDTAREPSKYKVLNQKKYKSYLSREELLGQFDAGQLKEYDLLVHLGACTDTTEKDIQFLTKNNLEYSQKLAQWALAHGKKFHYASSAAVYGDGQHGYSDFDIDIFRYKALNPYAESKLAFDRWLRKEKLSTKAVGFRYFNVFGPNEYHKGEMRSMVCKAFQQIKEKGFARLFATTRPDHPDGSELRDFVYVKDAVKMMAFFLENPAQYGIFNVGTGQARSFKDLVEAVFAALETPPVIDYFPMPDNLRKQYQYFTEAKMDSLRMAGYNTPFMSLEDSVADYVQNYLAKDATL